MNIFGVGGMEFALVLIIMLVVAGPKRMIQWAYTLGRYTAKMRRMWEETSAMLQKEFDAAGLDVQVPKEMPTRQNLNQMTTKALEPLTKPIQEAMTEVEQTQKELATTVKPGTTPNGRKTESAAAGGAPSEQPPASNFGTWSGQSAKSDDSEGQSS